MSTKPSASARLTPRPARPGIGALLVLTCVAATLGCRHVPHRTGSSVEVVVDGRALIEKNPVDVVVAPILDTTEPPEAPVAVLREAFQDALVGRRYSPLSLEYVDRQVIDATYIPGTLQEEAVLQVVIHNWDAHMWEATRRIEVDIEARMVDPNAAGGDPLWAGRVRDVVNMRAEENAVPTETALMARLCTYVAREVLGGMPARTAKP